MTSYFGDFQPEELDLVLSVPYRAGIWISHIDDVAGTARDESREQIALEKILNKIHDKAGHDTFVHEILHEILTHKSQWTGWGASSVTTLSDVSRAVAMVKARLPKSETVQYQKCVFHIAKTVALAASEQGGDLSKDVMGNKFLTKLSDWLSVKTDDAVPENISSSEQAALKELLQRLKA